jgi:hypothetical protein
MTMTNKPGNWAGNYFYEAAAIHQPETVEQVRELVRHSDRVKALGTRHSFNDIADSPGDLISLERFDKILGLDDEHRTVTVEAGVRYGQLARWLHGEGYALHNLASLPHISVAGACATATHGSGDKQGNLATVVSALEWVTGRGDLVRLSREENPAPRLARTGRRRIAVIAPAFSSDCVETLEEINGEIRESFMHAGGEAFSYVPCLNADEAHIDMIEAIATSELAGWVGESER